MLIHSAEITGSVQFNNTDVSGITNVAGFATTASVNALVVKTGSYASTSSVNELQSKTGSYTSTSSFGTYTSSNDTTNTTQNTRLSTIESVTGSYTSTSSFGAYSSSINTFTSSATTRLNTIESVTGSFASTSSVNNLQSVTGSYASTGSNQFNGNQSISGSITSNGTITAQTLVVQTVTSSIEFVTGSTRNGSIAGNTHQFTGSVSITGSAAALLNINNGVLYVSASGNVGIGISSPSTYGFFVVNSANASSGISTVIRNSTDTGGDNTRYAGVDFMVGSDNGTAAIRAYRTNSATDYSTALTFLTKGSGANATIPTENMRITSTGNVGIGTTSPSVKLEVSDATNAIIKVNATSDGAQAALSLNGYASGGVYRASRLNFQQAGTNKWSILQDYNQDNTNSLTFEQAGTRRVVFDASGNVGIGTNTPGAKLDVSGNIKFNNIVSTDYSISFSGIGAGAWYNIPEVNLNGFFGLVTIGIQNNNASYGYTVRASAWIFQTGINGDNIYSGLRSVTIRPDGVSYEGINVVESYHTAPTSGRYNIRMRLRVRDAGLSAENPLNLQIWVDSTTSFPASGTLSLKAI
jgi:hypothetical protein